ncbi:hypothetical protein [Mesorhizobium sp.]|uniref:hypothetical protein n=1 Tax=Mesorhizobium sp. TaxID=1871066 RepID=UPI0025BCF317|nr:hypothetical protein [Mesorhizobium sp.]
MSVVARHGRISVQEGGWFGPPPDRSTFLNLARLKLSPGAGGIVKIEAGPVAIAIDFSRIRPRVRADWKSDPTAHEDDHRFVVRCATKPGPERLAAAVKLVKASLVLES